MGSSQEGRQYAAPPRGSSESYRSNRNNSRTEYEDFSVPNRRTPGNDMNEGANGQRRFLGSLPENAQLSQGSLPPAPEDHPNGKEPGNTDSVSPSKDRTQQGSNKPPKQQRVCKACGENLTGQFVRALDGTFHLNCFRCRDCGDIVASKFFPMEDTETGEGPYPLCERDYFARIDLICHTCGGALRGSYVTALDHKYHIDHFTCSVCPTAFGAKDSYYEHDGKVYCHYHYSTRFAQRCNGCQTAILKQFVEIFRNGENQHWHPECYMIHKFWNVRLASSSKRDEAEETSEEDASEEKRAQVRIEEEQMEDKTYRIWSVLSAFEETSAACISDMLLHVSNGAYMEGVLVAKKFIQHVDILFSATDSLDAIIISNEMSSLTYAREAKLLCKRIVAFFTLLTKTQDTGVRRLGVTQELLSLVTGLAHYLKLLIRISLQGALKLEREKRSTAGLQVFLDDLAQLEEIRETNISLDDTASLSDLADEQSDCCLRCLLPIDEECFKLGQKRCHPKHLQCSNCHQQIGGTRGLQNAIFYPATQEAFCPDCSGSHSQTDEAFVPIERVTRLQQYVYLLRVALARLLAVLRTGGILPHTSDDPNLTQFNSSEGHRLDPTGTARPALSPDSRSKSFGGRSEHEQNQNTSSYSETVGEMKRLRSTRMDKHLSTTMRQARMSRIIPDTSGPGQNNFRIEDEHDGSGHARADIGIGADSLTLDDIPRIAAAQTIKDQRPNAYRHAQNKLLGTSNKIKYSEGHERNLSTGLEGASGNLPRERTKKYFSELTALEYFIVRHVAVLQMQPMLEGHFNLEDLLSLIELRKQTFWGKFFKNEKSKGGKKKGVFGVALDTLVERDGVDSDQGVGPGALRIPSLLDEAINAMRQMDMSIEGIFRKNGNIRKMKELAERIDTKESEIDLEKESPVQIAALLKKFLRDMPDPLLTFKLYNLFSASQKITDDMDQRRRLLHLTCCLLPKVNRDSLEVLLHFLNWTASFAEVDHETGSKMDTHNLATVIAPNILYQDEKIVGATDESFLSIEAVNMLLEYNDQMCTVPEDIQSVLSDTELFNNMPEVTTKEILKRYGDVAKQPQRHFGSARPEAADMPPIRNADNDTGPSNSRAGAPVPVRVQTDPSQYNASQKESSVRHVQNGAGPTAYATPNMNAPSQYQQGFNGPSPYHTRGMSYERDYGTPGRQGVPAFGRSNIPAADTS